MLLQARWPTTAHSERPTHLLALPWQLLHFSGGGEILPDVISEVSWDASLALGIPSPARSRVKTGQGPQSCLLSILVGRVATPLPAIRFF